MDIIRIQSETILLSEAEQAVRDPSAGGHAFFVGTVRDSFDGRASRGLFYEAYAPLAEKEMRRIVDELRHEFGVLHAAVIHRVGELVLGEIAVVVAVSAPHRQEALAAAAAGIDRVKARVPIWKKERWADGADAWHHDPANLGEKPL
jgi:molybdopterin synthase catalytic subunit